MGSSSNPLRLEDLVKCLILLVMLGLIFSGVHAARGLMGDGSSFIFFILSRGGYWLWDIPRVHVQFLNQAPLALALYLGVTDLSALIRLHSLGLVAIPILIWMIALMLHFRSWLFWIFTLAFSVTYLSSSLFAVGEYNVAYAFVALATSILLRPQLTLGGALALLISMAALVRSYETLIFLGPFLGGLAFYRMRRESSKLIRIILALAVFLSALSFLVSAHSILFHGRPANLADAANLSVPLSTDQFAFMVSVLVLLFGSIVLRGRTWWQAGVLLIYAGATIVLFLRPWSWQFFSLGHPFRVMAGLFLLMTLSLAVYVNFQPKILSQKNSRLFVPALIAGIVFMFSVLAISLQEKTTRFYIWAQRVERVVTAQTGFVHVDRTEIYLDREFHWEWFYPALSIVLRGDVDAVILNHSSFSGWQPFDPRRFTRNPLGRYQKESPIFP